MKKLMGFLMGLLVMGLVSCSDDDDVAQLVLSGNQVSLQVGKTANITITSSAGECTATVENMAVATAKIEGSDIVISALSEGSTVVNVSDEEGQSAAIQVEVALNEKKTKLSELTSMVKSAPADLQAQLKDYQIEEPVEENYLTTGKYNVELDGLKAMLSVEMFKNSILSLKVEAVGEMDEQAFFTSLKSIVEANSEYAFRAAVIGSYEADGTVDATEVYTDKAQAEELLSEIDMKFGCYKFGYTFDTDYTVSVELNKGKATMHVRPSTFPAEWKWFTTFIGKDMTEVINEYYFAIKSVGMIPPMFQIFKLEGKDMAGEKMNIMFFAEGYAPISRIEANYQIEDLDKAKAHWISEMASADVNEKYGTFVNTVILQKDQSVEPVQLATLAETIEWVKTNDINSVECVIPMFKTAEGWTISPQLDYRGFAITITEMK